MSIMRTKTIEQSIAETDEAEFHLKRRLSAVDLTVFGIGVIIGAGIFTLTGRAAQAYAGPAIVISFAAAALACGLAALCYAEFASTVPVAGSAYTFSYATLGEIVAWIIGWDLLLEMMLGASVVAQGWSQYFVVFLKRIGITWPESIAPGATFDAPAFLLVIVLTALVAYGIKESLRVNLVLVALKLFVVLFVIVAGLAYVNTANYAPFIPDPVPAATVGGDWLTSPLIQVISGFSPTTYGWGGIFAGASIVFFAYIGFDVVATTAEEAENPQRDLPIGIIASLVICTILYIAVALVITGMVHYDHINPQAALATAFNAKTGTPVKLTIAIGTTVAFVAAFTPIGNLEQMVNIGTLTAFILVSLAVPVLRKKRPDLKRSFTVPLSPVLPVLSALACLWLTLNLSVETWFRFLIWMALGFFIYFGYSHRSARLAKHGHAAEHDDAHTH